MEVDFFCLLVALDCFLVAVDGLVAGAETLDGGLDCLLVASFLPLTGVFCK